MSTSFADLGVPSEIIAALSRRGVTEPFEIQAATIMDAMAGRDVCGRAPTGSGKTLAFGIPLVARSEKAQPNRPNGLVLAPTRELADQIHEELKTFAGPTKIGVVYGGVGYGPQVSSLRRGVDILVACPGRLEDLIEQGVVKLDAVNQVVLDEADRMADMGFMPAVKRILDQTRSDRQTVLFSATLDGDVAKLTRDYQTNPARHEVGEETPDITAASHLFWSVSRNDRVDVTADAINAVWPAIVFCRTRHGSDRLAKQLSRSGIQAAAIHGGRSQRQRTRALADFSEGRVHALVATDVAARGIHVDGVASVVHYDPPEDHKTYVHRSGRTARAGQGGVVVSLLQPEQVKDAKKMQKRIDLDEPVTTPDAVHMRSISPAPERVLQPAKPEDRESAPPRSRKGGPSGKRRPNARARDGRSGGNEGSRSGKGARKHASSTTSKSKAKRSGSSSAASESGRPNRKSRRAHLQKG